MAAAKGNKHAKGNKGGGKSRYKAEYADLAFKYCLLGATDAELATFFEVTEQTINNWKRDHQVFFESIKKGKHQADANVASRLYDRAMGYVAPETVTAQKDGFITDMQQIQKHYPPDTTAAIFWLKNRQKDKWREKSEMDVTTQGESLNKAITPDEAKNLIENLKNGNV